MHSGETQRKTDNVNVCMCPKSFSLTALDLQLNLHSHVTPHGFNTMRYARREMPRFNRNSFRTISLQWGMLFLSCYSWVLAWLPEGWSSARQIFLPSVFGCHGSELLQTQNRGWETCSFQCVCVCVWLDLWMYSSVYLSACFPNSSWNILHTWGLCAFVGKSISDMEKRKSLRETFYAWECQILALLQVFHLNFYSVSNVFTWGLLTHHPPGGGCKPQKRPHGRNW